MSSDIISDGAATPTHVLLEGATAPLVVHAAGVEILTALNDEAARPAGDLLAPRALTELDGLYWRIAEALGAPEKARLVPAILELLPLTDHDRRQFDSGFRDGVLPGAKEVIDQIASGAEWYRTALLELLAILTDLNFWTEAYSEDLREAIRAGNPLQNQHILAYYAEHAPYLYSCVTSLDNLARFSELMLAKFIAWAARSDGLLDLAARVRAEMLTWYLKSLAEFLAAQAKLSRNRYDQGKALGGEIGRAGAEAVMIALTDGVAAELKLTKLTGPSLTAAQTMSPELAELFSIRKAIAKGGTLEKVLAEAYQGFGGGKFAAYRKMREYTGEFNKFWRRLQETMGWNDRRLRLDAHHVAEARIMSDAYVKSNADWQAALAKLKWKSKDDMFAVALETELHLEKGSRLAEYIGPKAGSAIENLDSLTVGLLEEVGRDFSRYPTFESYLVKLEEIYRKPILVKRPNSEPVRIAPLWEHMKPAIAEMRKRLGLPAPGD